MKELGETVPGMTSNSSNSYKNSSNHGNGQQQPLLVGNGYLDNATLLFDYCGNR